MNQSIAGTGVSIRRLFWIATAVAAALPAVAVAAGPTTRRTDFLPFGTEAFHIPPAIIRIDVPPHAIELLTHAIHTQTGPNRSLYVTALGECGPAALPPLRPLLHDADATIRADAVRAIAAIGTTEAAADVRPMLSDPDAEVRREAALALPRLSDASGLTPALGDIDAGVRAAAYAGVAMPEQAKTIVARLPNLEVAEQALAIDAVGRIGGPADGIAISALANSAESAVRVAVVRAIGRLRPPAGTAVVLAASHDPFGPVRREAISAMGRVLAIENWKAAAIEALNDNDPTVREAAADLLATSPTTNAMQPLAAELSDDYEPGHLAARRALEAAGRIAYPIAEAMLDDPNPARRADGLDVLGGTAEPIRVDRKIELLGDAHDAVVSAAARSLFKLRPHPELVGPSIQAIIQRTEGRQAPSTDTVDAEAAAIQLAGLCGDQEITPTILLLIPVEFEKLAAPDEVRQVSLWSVGVLAAPGSRAQRVVQSVFTEYGVDDGDLFEAIKAFINMHDVAALPLIQHWDTDALFMGRNRVQMIAHLAVDRLTHRTTPYRPVTQNLTPILPVKNT